MNFNPLIKIVGLLSLGYVIGEAGAAVVIAVCDARERKRVRDERLDAIALNLDFIAARMEAQAKKGGEPRAA